MKRSTTFLLILIGFFPAHLMAQRAVVITGNVPVQNAKSPDRLTSPLSSPTRFDLILPVQILSFKAESLNCSIDLAWSAAEENNFDTYEIQYCTDGKSFETVGTLPVRHSNSNYSFHHASPSPGKIFYRLKMVNVDGMFQYSKVLTEDLDCGNEISVYPNPVSDILNIKTTVSKTGCTSASLFDVMGNLVYSCNIKTGITTINMVSFARGLYIIILKKDGAQLQALKIFK